MISPINTNQNKQFHFILDADAIHIHLLYNQHRLMNRAAMRIKIRASINEQIQKSWVFMTERNNKKSREDLSLSPSLHLYSGIN